MVRDLTSDYPRWALKKNESAGTVFSVLVDPEGRALRCAIVAVVGSYRLAEYVCEQLKRVRFEPATDATGAKRYGKIVGLIKMALPDTEIGRQIIALRQKPDVELTVTSIPDKEERFREVKVQTLVNDNGLIEDCNGSDNSTNGLTAAACKVLEGEKLPIETAGDGSAISYVQEMTVSFSVE
ncbi:energy transducer TonB [Qipengyuania atrilutea]|uniref:Energy transducer TonB n=1 Tax=Qipengyuania atrilutea TaxID=2744473 RepID=A0A850H1M9_9SPHN|nr:energy transducer TonB [Actirhodobacter atriluteus]NVD44142.1 energy transducer TonB [Actirhodobacter atriluteus]